MKKTILFLAAMALAGAGIGCGKDKDNGAAPPPAEEKPVGPCFEDISIKVNWSLEDAPAHSIQHVQLDWGYKKDQLAFVEEVNVPATSIELGPLIRGINYYFQLKGFNRRGEVTSTPVKELGPPTCKELETIRQTKPGYDYPLEVNMKWHGTQHDDED
ncbi:MAG: hypothetical protein H6624_05025 [Bdellovibrionaceae bacterium]|nr:hypothetical protein [Bdellovibrionales bacterium]MCB9083681.1 hypothetical protein [Pseudobdellovibrionaceae bacterium]